MTEVNIKISKENFERLIQLAACLGITPEQYLNEYLDNYLETSRRNAERISNDNY